MIAHVTKETVARAVTLSSEEVAQAVQLLERLIRPDAVGQQPFSSITSCARAKLLTVAKLVQVVRKTRTRHFSPAMFGEPPWDLLVGLYISEDGGQQQTVSTLAKQAEIPVSTALRWIDYLDEKKLIERQPSNEDRRTIVVSLSTKGREALESYLHDVMGSLAAAPRA